MKRSMLILVVWCLVFGSGRQGKADIITFDAQGLTGPTTFAAASQENINVTSPGGVGVGFANGTILTDATNLPADETSIYGTAGFAGIGYTSSITITFNQPIHNFIVDVLNGWTITANFQVSDNLGDSSIVSLAPNLSGGSEQVAFAAAGTEVTVTQLTNDPNVDGWDFFIDNIQFDVPLPGAAIPEPSPIIIWSLLGTGAMGLGWWRRRKAA